MKKSNFLIACMVVLGAVLPVRALRAQPIVIQGQDAVSTNFAPEAVQLYGLGSNLGLQLNQANLLSADPYYADFVFTAEQSGEYVVWYGGSPPGAKDPFLASYGSPFDLILNDELLLNVTAETVSTGAVYSTPYQWVRVGEIELEQGQHSLRMSVDQRRRYDARFFLYLDRLVLVPRGTVAEFLPAEEELLSEPLSIEDVLIELRDEPTNIDAYIQLAHLYTLVGDHINALRYLNRAQFIESNNPEMLQLVARNRIWQGDIEGGLGAYWGLVSADPLRLDSFLEAGKIAAWNGFLGASEQYYLAGLDHHPDDIRILVNLGYTYLWGAREDRARDMFVRAVAQADTVEKLLILGAEFRANADPAREEALYRAGRSRFPDSVPLAEQLLEAVYQQGDLELAAALRRELEQELPAATGQLARVEQRYALRNERIAEYEAAVRENPDDVSRRSELAQTYFWVGRRTEGIRAFQNQLALQTQQALHRTWTENEAQIWDAFHAGLMRLFIREYLAEITRLRSELQEALQAYQSVAAQEDADTSAEEAGVAAVMGPLEEAMNTVELALSFYQGAVPARLAATLELIDDRRAELEAISEQLGWNAPVEQISEELSSADDVVGSVVTSAIMTGILQREHTPEELPRSLGPAPLEAEALRRVQRNEAAPLLVLNAHDAAASVELWLALEELVLEESETRPTDLIAFTELFRDQLRRVGRIEEARQTRPAAVAFTPQAADAMAAKASELTVTLAQQLRVLEEHFSTFEELNVLSTELALFYLQTETASERTRLGQLYIDSNDIALGVQQLEMVRAVDPDNLDTLYTLAQAYRRLGSWRRAQILFAEIHAVDPGFRNTMALHNQIARQYADTFQAQSRIVTEPQRVETRSSLSYLWRINSRYSVRAGFETATIRAQVPDSFSGPNPGDLSTSVVRRLAYQEHLLHVGLPLSFLGERLVIEPRLAGRFIAHNLYFASLANGLLSDVWDSADYFGNYQLEPEPGIALQFSRDELFLSGHYRFGTYTPAQDIPIETSRLEHPFYRSHYFNGTLSWNLQPRPHPLWNRYSQRTSGSVDAIMDGSSLEGTRYQVSQEFRMALIRLSEPFTRLGVAAKFGYEDYDGDEVEWYYQPDSVFEAGLSLDWQLYRATGASTSWGVSGSVYSGYYESEFEFSADDPAIRTAANLTGELTRSNIAFQLNISGSRVLLADEFTSFPNDGGYYDIGLTLGVVARNFELLSR